MGWSALLGVPAGSVDVPAGSVPARAEICRVAATFIWVGAIDLFVDEDIDFARRLIACGVPTELVVVPGVYHGFDGASPGATVTIDYKMAMLKALARAFGTPLAADAAATFAPNDPTARLSFP